MGHGQGDANEREQNPEQQERRLWTRGNKKGCLIVIAALLGLVVLVGVCNALLGDGGSGTPAMPTHTPRLQPTLAPSCSTPREAAYFAEMFAAIGEFIAVTEEAEAVAIQAGNDLSLIHDAEWRLAVSIVLGKFWHIQNKIDAMHPPGALVYIHKDVMQMAKKGGHFAANWGHAIDYEDWTYLDLAGDDIEMASDLAILAMAKATAYCD